MANADIKLEAKKAGVKLWQISEKLGLCDCNFSRKLRHELLPKEKAEIRSIIVQLKEGE